MSIQDDLQTGQKKLVSRYRELILGILIIAGIILIGLSFLRSFPADLRELLRSIGLTVAPSGIVTLFLSRYADFIAELSIKNTIQNQFQASFQQFEAGIKKNVTDQIQTCVNENFESVRTMLDDQKDKIEGRLNTLTPSFSLLSSGTRYGVENIHLNRAQALESFNWFLDSELGKAYKGEPSRIWIVSSSIKGLLTIVTDHFDGKRLFEKIRDSKCDIRVLMTHPNFANYRADQEKREHDEIPHEIKMNISIIKNYGIQRDKVKFYNGTPTVFGIATMDRMLLNPYPYQSEAFRCFSLIVLKTNNTEEDIYHQYLRYHFEEPWNKADPVADDYWGADIDVDR